ncbi:hypothetical protein FKM82_027800 [Ascaphus truei]
MASGGHSGRFSYPTGGRGFRPRSPLIPLYSWLLGACGVPSPLVSGVSPSDLNFAGCRGESPAPGAGGLRHSSPGRRSQPLRSPASHRS